MMRCRSTHHLAAFFVALTAVLSSIGISLLFETRETLAFALSATGIPKHQGARQQQLERAIGNRNNDLTNVNWGKSRLAASPGEAEEPGKAEEDDDRGCGCSNEKTAQCRCHNPDTRRRQFLRDQFVGSIATATASSSSSALFWSSNPGAASAKTPKSRTEGYAVQRTEREWAYVLSGAQYNILRRGGTERQKSSILNTFTDKDVGTYYCAACQTALFESSDKFSSGTGWPSFARSLPTVEPEDSDPISATLAGREVRCGTCGGHLGDLFNDGWVYVGTKAFETGNRYCIDGAALIFKPSGGGEGVYGDTPPPNRVINYEPAMFRDNSINSRQ